MDTKILKIGRGILKDITKTLRSANIGQNILYVSDTTVDNLYGNIVKEQLHDFGSLYEVSVPNNTLAFANILAEKAVDTEIDCIIGLGGGSVLDVCKFTAHAAQKPLLLLPTTAANDGIASSIAVLKGDNGKLKSLVCTRPAIILIDIELISQAPAQLIRAGIGDILSNRMALLDWKLACSRGKDQMSDYAYFMSQNAVNVLLNTKHCTIGIDFVKDLTNAHVMSGLAMDYAKSSKAVSGSEHLFSHALDRYSNVKNLHGIQTGLGTIAILKLIGEDYTELLDFFNRYQVDINPSRLGITEDSFVYCIQHAPEIRKDRYTYLHEIDLSDTLIRKLYRDLTNEL